MVAMTVTQPDHVKREDLGIFGF